MLARQQRHHVGHLGPVQHPDPNFNLEPFSYQPPRPLDEPIEGFTRSGYEGFLKDRYGDKTVRMEYRDEDGRGVSHDSVQMRQAGVGGPGPGAEKWAIIRGVLPKAPRRKAVERAPPNMQSRNMPNYEQCNTHRSLGFLHSSPTELHSARLARLVTGN